MRPRWWTRRDAGRGRGGLRPEAVAVVARRRAEQAQEGPAHRLLRAEAAGPDNSRKPHPAVLQAPSRRLNPQALQHPRRRHPDLGTEGAGELPRAEARALGHGLHRERPVQVLAHPGQQVVEAARRPGGLGGERGAELLLPAGPAQEQHQVARRGEGEGVPVVLLDEGQGQVHARGDARRGPDVAVADVDRLRVHPQPRVAVRELGAVAPVRRRAPAVQQPGRGQDERAGAHSHDAMGARCQVADEPLDGGIIGTAPRPFASRDDQRVERGAGEQLALHHGRA